MVKSNEAARWPPSLLLPEPLLLVFPWIWSSLFLFEAKGLVEVVVERRHFAKLASEELLNCSGSIWIGIGGLLKRNQ